MPKPRATPRASQANVSIEYWQNFLRKMNLVGPIMEKTTKPVEGETQAIMNPMFQKFLNYLSGYGVLKPSEFQQLPESQKTELLRAFLIWQENIRKKGIKP